MQMSFKFGPIFGEAVGLPRKPLRPLSDGEVIPFHERDVDTVADWRTTQELKGFFLLTEDNFCTNRDHSAFPSLLYHLSVFQVGRRQQFWLSRSAPLARFPLYILQHAVDSQQRRGVVRKFITGEERDVFVGHLLNLVNEQISVLLRPFTNYEGR